MENQPTFVNKDQPITGMLEALHLLEPVSIKGDYRRGFLENIGNVYYIRRVHQYQGCSAIHTFYDIQVLVDERLALEMMYMGYVQAPRWFGDYCGREISGSGRIAYKRLSEEAAKILLNKELEKWERETTKREG